ncbi:MAG: four helix bundle protein [Bacteroidales bacterium]|nr:four helix bundle protein [Bacteroidales bacterium]
MEEEIFSIEEPIGNYNQFKVFTSLQCWKDAREVKLFFYRKVLPCLPPEEKFNLDIQIRKASCSITSNISEGHGRFHYQEAIQFCRISRGSLSELKDHLISCYDFEYINEATYQDGLEKIEKAKISLNGFIAYNERKKKELKVYK